MLLFNKDEEIRILEVLESVKNDKNYYGIYFYFSKLEERNKNNFQIKIAINIIKDFFKNSQGCITHFKDNDIAIIFSSENRAIIEKIIFQLRYLFIDDSLAFEVKGVENHKFCSVYMLSFQWHDFYMACNRKKPEENSNINIIDKDLSFSKNFGNLHIELDSIDITRFVRYQEIYGYNSLSNIFTPIYREIYINFSSLKEILNLDQSLSQNNYLSKYIFDIINDKLLDLLSYDYKKYLSESFSISLSINNILDKSFLKFAESLKSSNFAKSVIIELHIGDIFNQFESYLIIRELLSSMNFRLSIKGLSETSFLQINREKINADFLKIHFTNIPDNEDYEYINNIASMIKISGVNRVILSQCDDQETTEYGKYLGIKLFQGQNINKIYNDTQDFENNAINSKWELYKN